MHDVTTQKLMDDLRAVVSDAEALVAATAGDVGSQAETARKRAAESLAHARARLHTLEQQAKERVTAAAHEADHYVHENPWQSIAIAAGVGALVGILLARR
jgi:ElaB/YqjD/DUF883 family membrane-anchored ribosome-binding protein